MSSFYKVINNNKMEPKKKEKLYTSPAEQQQLPENFYNDLDDETYKNMSWTWIITIFYDPKNILLFISLTQKGNL